MAFEHVIFDCDGVLVDSEWLACHVEAELLAELGVPITAGEVRDRFVGMTMAGMQAEIEAQHGIALPDDFLAEHARRLFAVFDERLQPVPGVPETLAALPCLKSVASNSGQARVERSLAITGLTGFFDGRVFSSELVARPKPAPDVFLHVLERAAAPASRSVVIEDGASGTIAAREAGIRVVGFTGGSHCNAETAGRLCAAGAEVICDDMRFLPDLLRDIS